MIIAQLYTKLCYRREHNSSSCAVFDCVFVTTEVTDR